MLAKSWWDSTKFLLAVLESVTLCLINKGWQGKKKADETKSVALPARGGKLVRRVEKAGPWHRHRSGKHTVHLKEAACPKDWPHPAQTLAAGEAAAWRKQGASPPGPAVEQQGSRALASQVDGEAQTGLGALLVCSVFHWNRGPAGRRRQGKAAAAVRV